MHLMRPLWGGGLTLIGLLGLTLDSPYLASLPITPEWRELALSARVFVYLVLCCGAFYGLLLNR
jgi:hypothetical protein